MIVIIKWKTSRVCALRKYKALCNDQCNTEPGDLEKNFFFFKLSEYLCNNPSPPWLFSISDVWWQWVPDTRLKMREGMITFCLVLILLQIGSSRKWVSALEQRHEECTLSEGWGWGCLRLLLLVCMQPGLPVVSSETQKLCVKSRSCFKRSPFNFFLSLLPAGQNVFRGLVPQSTSTVISGRHPLAKCDLF